MVCQYMYVINFYNTHFIIYLIKEVTEFIIIIVVSYLKIH